MVNNNYNCALSTAIAFIDKVVTHLLSIECVLGEDRFYILTPIDIILAEVSELGSLGSRPSPFRARFHYAHAVNIRSKLVLASNVYRMRIMKTRTERGRPGTEAMN